jgi:hypothetical protein
LYFSRRVEVLANSFWPVLDAKILAASMGYAAHGASAAFFKVVVASD